MKVSDFMNDAPALVKPEDTLDTALKVMADQKTRHLVVMKEGEEVAGIITDGDLAMFYDPANMTAERWAQAKVSDLMTMHPTSIGSHAPIEEAAKLLVKMGVSALPVVENGVLRGILSEKDFVRHFARNTAR
jgi:acetoin utilization protein AcuB